MRQLGLGVLLATVLAATPGEASAEVTDNFRLLVHGHKSMKDSPWGVAGWVLAPNVTSAPNRWLAIAGPRYTADVWWLEVTGGLIIQQGAETPLLDLRASYRAFAPLVLWTNWQWINFVEPDASTGYAYLMADYVLPGKLLALGGETENFFPRGKKAQIGGGPHAIVMFERIAFVFAYQLTNGSDDLFWVRLVINP